MALHALVVIEFDEITPEQYARFSTGMDEMDWLEVPNIANAWAANFPNATNPNDSDVIQALSQTAVDAVAEAAGASGIKQYHAAIQIGVFAPTLFDFSTKE